jgi:hypothetical protein
MQHRQMQSRTDAELHSGENAGRGNQMAKICFMREGLTGRVDPVAEKPLAWCIEELGLRTADWWADLETKFIIDKWIELSPYSQLRWVLIRLDETEASGNWKIGYYFSPLIKVADVINLL